MAVAFIAGSAHAYSADSNDVIFGDTAVYWQGWANDSDDNLQSNDTIGRPNLLGGFLQINEADTHLQV